MLFSLVKTFSPDERAIVKKLIADSYDDFINQLSNHNNFIIDFGKYKNINILTKTVLVPFFGKEFSVEMDNLIGNSRKSLTYKAIERVLSILNAVVRI